MIAKNICFIDLYTNILGGLYENEDNLGAGLVVPDITKPNNG